MMDHIFTITINEKELKFAKKVKIIDLIDGDVHDYIAALVNNKLRELNYEVFYDAKVELLTQKDYDNTKILMKITGAINNLFGDIPDDTPKSRIKINMDGTGKVEFENPKSGDKLIVKHGNSGSNSGEK